MPADFRGLTVISLESRRSAEMAALIARHHGLAVSAPSMREVPNLTHDEALAFAQRLLAGQIDIVILLTGVGARMLVDAMATKHDRATLMEALQRVPLVCRGPKPVAVLRELGLKPALEVPEPNTWQDLLKALDARLPVAGKRVAVQEYGVPNERLIAGLSQRGAEVQRVPIYQWALPEDLSPLRGAIDAVIAGKADVVMFTSATQVYHLLQLAEKDGKAAALRDGFRRVLIASIGPVASEAIVEHGLQPDYEPDSPHMAPLVHETARRVHDLLLKKRTSALCDVDTNRWRRVDAKWQRAGASSPPVAGAADGPARGRIEDSIFLKACRREPTPYTPIWLMRQAGRYQRAYRDIRAGTTMMGLCRDSALAAEVTLMAVDRLGVDAAIIFSDILTVVEPLGFSLDFVKGDGPVIANPFRERADIARLREADPAELSYVYDAIRITRAALRPDIALIGFCGGPFTVASYIIEGGKSKDYAKTKTLMYRDAISWNVLMDKLVELQIAYLNRQIAAGADAVQIFDSWAGSLSPDDYKQYVMPHVRRLVEGVRSEESGGRSQEAGARSQGSGGRNQGAAQSPRSASVGSAPIIHFATGNPALLPLMKEAGGDVIGLDFRVDLADAWRTLGDDVAVMGNLDPVVLFCSPAEIRRQAKAILDKAAGRPGHIFNLGHGITPDMPPENVAELVDVVHELSQR